jgi:Carbohydrate binding domain (family 11)
VSDSPDPDKRPSLAELHDRALAEPRDAGAEGARRFVAWLDNRAGGHRGDPARPTEAADAVVPFEEATSWWRGAIPRALAVAALAVGIASVFGHWVTGRSVEPPEAQVPTPEAPMPSPVAAEPRDKLGPGDPCRDAKRAGGAARLVDDFEDANELVALLEGRNGYWVTITDTQQEATESVLLPSVRPMATPSNRYAVHLAGERRAKWGASVQVEFGPTCYDASIYRGISFDVLGPGRVYAGVREVDAVPVQRGGTCTTACYDSHLSAVGAASSWTHHEIDWSDLHQRGKTEPANPRRLSGIEFLVRSEDTPYDLWIDNVAFVR